MQAEDQRWIADEPDRPAQEGLFGVEFAGGDGDSSLPRLDQAQMLGFGGAGCEPGSVGVELQVVGDRALRTVLDHLGQSELMLRGQCSEFGVGGDGLGEGVDPFQAQIADLCRLLHRCLVCLMMGPDHESPHDDVVDDEWVFTAWTPTVGVISGYRITGRTAWYFTAVAVEHAPLVMLSDSEVPVRSNPLVVKGDALWADHVCDDPMRQWTVSNEAMAVALTDPDAALSRAYGDPTPLAMDLEWYAVAAARPIEEHPSEEGGSGSVQDGYVQDGVVHGVVEVAGREPLHLVEVTARRWRRWSTDGPLGPLPLPVAHAHSGIRAPFGSADGSVLDLVLTPDGWQTRRSSRPDHDGGRDAAGR